MTVFYNLHLKYFIYSRSVPRFLFKHFVHKVLEFLRKVASNLVGIAYQNLIFGVKGMFLVADAVYETTQGPDIGR